MMKKDEIIGTTFSELMENTDRLKKDPEAQKRFSEELDKQGICVNFDGPCPALSAKDIYISKRD